MHDVVTYFERRIFCSFPSPQLLLIILTYCLNNTTSQLRSIVVDAPSYLAHCCMFYCRSRGVGRCLACCRNRGMGCLLQCLISASMQRIFSASMHCLNVLVSPYGCSASSCGCSASLSDPASIRTNTPSCLFFCLMEAWRCCFPS